MLFEESAPLKLVGIARMAAESAPLAQKTKVEYFEIAARSFVGRCSGTRMPFVWTVNPYRGCEFGCKYCYARYAHEFMELRDPLQFERRIFVKRFSAAAFRQEMGKVKPGESVWIGTATDPYQPAERRFGVTREILRVLVELPGQNIGITTKSDLVSRDSGLLGLMAKHSIVHVNMTVTTMNNETARLLEPLAPRPDLRMAAVRTLADAGVRTTVLASPVMPLINDSRESLEQVCAAGARAGAQSFSAAPLFLKNSAKQVFLPFLREQYPRLYSRYRDRYEREAYLTGDYPEKIREMVQTLTVKYGLRPRQEEHIPEDWPAQRQLQLFDDAGTG